MLKDETKTSCFLNHSVAILFLGQETKSGTRTKRELLDRIHLSSPIDIIYTDHLISWEFAGEDKARSCEWDEYDCGAKPLKSQSSSGLICNLKS